MYMGVRNREEIKQILNLNQSQHDRKKAIMDKIEATKKQNQVEKEVVDLQDPMNKQKKMEDDPGFTQDNLMSYPLLKPIAFSNAIEDDYLSSGTWNYIDQSDPHCYVNYNIGNR